MTMTSSTLPQAQHPGANGGDEAIEPPIAWQLPGSYEPQLDDVVFGPGSGFDKERFPGNLRFLSLLQDFVHHEQQPQNQAPLLLSQCVVEPIQRRNGKFLFLQPSGKYLELEAHRFVVHFLANRVTSYQQLQQQQQEHQPVIPSAVQQPPVTIPVTVEEQQHYVKEDVVVPEVAVSATNNTTSCSHHERSRCYNSSSSGTSCSISSTGSSSRSELDAIARQYKTREEMCAELRRLQVLWQRALTSCDVTVLERAVQAEMTMELLARACAELPQFQLSDPIQGLRERLAVEKRMPVRLALAQQIQQLQNQHKRHKLPTTTTAALAALTKSYSQTYAQQQQQYHLQQQYQGTSLIVPAPISTAFGSSDDEAPPAPALIPRILSEATIDYDTSPPLLPTQEANDTNSINNNNNNKELRSNDNMIVEEEDHALTALTESYERLDRNEQGSVSAGREHCFPPDVVSSNTPLIITSSSRKNHPTVTTERLDSDESSYSAPPTLHLGQDGIDAPGTTTSNNDNEIVVGSKEEEITQLSADFTRAPQDNNVEIVPYRKVQDNDDCCRRRQTDYNDMEYTAECKRHRFV